MDYDLELRSRVATLISSGNYRVFAQLDSTGYTFPRALHRGLSPPRPVTIWCSNDYLGMSHSRAVVDAVSHAAREAGTGSGGSRNIAGTTNYHTDLEAALAALHSKERALLFTSAYLANESLMRLLGASFSNCVIFSDKQNHASIIHGIALSGAEKQIFGHNDIDALQVLLRRVDIDRPKVIVVESVYSVDGDVAPLREICALAQAHKALLVLDEVNGVGLYGSRGGGIAQELGLEDQVDVVVGTFGKAFGLAGGYIAGSANLVDYVRSFAPGFIFTTSIPTCIAAGALASIRSLQDTPDLHLTHRARVLATFQALSAHGIPILEGAHRHIIPVIVGDQWKCRALTERLLCRYEIYAQPINYPTVPVGTERLRITPTPYHTDDLVVALADALSILWDELGLRRDAQHA